MKAIVSHSGALAVDVAALVLRPPAVGLAVLAATMLTGCGTVREARDEVVAQQPIARKAISHPLAFAETPAVVERKGRMLTATAVTYQKNNAAWLRNVMVEINAGRPTSLSQIVAQLAAKGVNVTSDLPLENITFVGRINRTDAESALRLVLGSSGLDYDVDDHRKIVTIKPISARTWYINLGNRRSAFSTVGTQGTQGGNAQQMGGADPQSSGGQQGGQSSQPGQAGGIAQNAGNSSGIQGITSGQSNANGSQVSSTTGTDSSGGVGVSNNEDFWGALSRELTNRLQVLVPVPKNSVNRGLSSVVGSSVVAGSALPSPALGGPSMPSGPADPTMLGPVMQNGLPVDSGGAAGTADLYVSKKIGSFALNPETGAITGFAPILPDTTSHQG